MNKLAKASLTLGVLMPSLVAAQAPSTRLQIDREELTTLLAQYEAVARSTAYSEALREEVDGEVDRIRLRLSEGDFHTGDRIAFWIERPPGARWDTLTVLPGPEVEIPSIGSIGLQGLLRSELEEHLTAEISRFVQTPRVRARALVQIAVTGVLQPGFRAMGPDQVLSEAVMLLGGPSPGSGLDRMRIERGQDVIWSEEDLRAASGASLSLDDLGVQPGDRIVLPQSGLAGGGLGALLQQVVSFTLPSLLLQLVI